ncbi:MAG: PAS domain S-box protein [Cyanobacteria bacterium SID2]|nr:PAS domain S-box protein [Cyanobacteria bacterium SID2]MBP0003017.1 PAS domain S-box protein [Cyanobacteria bacterium SBC]
MFDRAIHQAIDLHPLTLAPETPVSEAIEQLSHHRLSTLFVVANDSAEEENRERSVENRQTSHDRPPTSSFLGVFGSNELLQVARESDFDRSQSVVDLINRDVPCARASELPSWSTLVSWFEEFALDAVPVLDDDGCLTGIVSRTALLREAETFERPLSELHERLERETAEQELLQEKLFTSYSQLRTILAAMQDIVLEIQLDGDNLEVGLPSPDPVDPEVSGWIDRTIACFFEDSYAGDFLQQVRRAIQSRETVRFEYCLLQDDFENWFEARISPIAQTSVVWVARNTDRSVDRSVLWVARDITARKRAEEAIKNLAAELERRVEARTAQLRSTNEILRAEIRKRQDAQKDLQQATDRLRAVLDAIPGFVSWIGADGCYQGVNRHLATAYGLAPQDFVGCQIGFQGSDTEFSDFVRQFLQNDIQTSGRVIDTPIGETIRQYLVVAQKYDRGRAAVTVGIDITERKQFEVALQQQQRLFQQIADATPDAIYVYDLVAKRNVYVNGQVKQLLGYTPNQIQTMSSQFLTLVAHPSDLHLLTRQHQRFSELSEDEVLASEYRVRGASGDWRWVHSREAVLTNTPEGQPAQIVGIVQDITDRKHAEEALYQLNQELEAKVAERTLALRHSEARFRTLFEQMAVGVAQVDSQGFWQFVNQKLCDILGYTAEELSRKSCLEMTHPEDIETTQCCLTKLLDGRATTCALEKRYLRADASIVWVNVTVSVVRDTSEVEYDVLLQTDPHFVVVVQDISDRKQTEAALKQQKEILQTIFDRIPVAISFLDVDETPQLVNRCFEETLGWSLQEAQKVDLFAACYPDPEYRQQVLEFVRSAVTGWQDFHILTRDRRLLEMSWANVRLSDGTTISFGQDITERKRAEAEVIKALEKERELIDLKSRFVSMTSHEFRTPLAIIKSSAQLLHRYEWSREEQLEQLDQIQSAVRHMTELLDDVLTFAKSEAGTLKFNPEQLELREFCQNLIAQLNNSIGRERTIIFEIVEPEASLTDNRSKRESIVRFDEKLLRQILTNLISNALKYSQVDRSVSFKTTFERNYVVFEVKDEGIGIPPEDLPRLFESFHRARNVGTIPGTGLGLSIVRRCVELHGGEIDVESQLGSGTRVIVTLPLTTESSVETTQSEASRRT